MKERIAVSPGIHFGKPCVAGTRIPVQSVLELVREGLSFAAIIRDYYPAERCRKSGGAGPPGYCFSRKRLTPNLDPLCTQVQLCHPL